MSIPRRFLAAFTGVAIAGILVGTWLVRFVSARALRRGFALFLLAIGGMMLYQNRGVLKIARTHSETAPIHATTH